MHTDFRLVFMPSTLSSSYHPNGKRIKFHYSFNLRARRIYRHYSARYVDYEDYVVLLCMYACMYVCVLIF